VIGGMSPEAWSAALAALWDAAYPVIAGFAAGRLLPRPLRPARDPSNVPPYPVQAKTNPKTSIELANADDNDD
jgi:hypothetical protein